MKYAKGARAFQTAAGEFDCSCRKRMRPRCPARSSRFMRSDLLCRLRQQQP